MQNTTQHQNQRQTQNKTYHFNKNKEETTKKDELESNTNAKKIWNPYKKQFIWRTTREN